MRKNLGLYIHIPFCKSKCHYCSFNSEVAGETRIREYVDALLREIKLRAKEYNAKYEIKTLYIGGGTPSSLELGMIREILKKVYDNFVVANNAEITIEINPNTLTKEKVDEYLSAGINRFSIGLQAKQERLLKVLGRRHSYQDFKKAVALLKNAGANNISADIMLGLPGQTLTDVLESVKELKSLGVKHISAYMLSIEEGTVYDRLVSEGLLKLPPESDTIKMYNGVVKQLASYGYNRYELSNFAMDGYQSKHNNLYWDRVDYLGVGSAAHSFIGGVRLANTIDVSQYISHLKDDEIALEFKDPVTTEEAKEETIMLSLRKTSGIDLDAYEREFGESLLATKSNEIKELIQDGFVIIDKNNHLSATDKGFMVMDKIISILAI